MLLSAGCGTPPKIVRQDPEIERNVVLARGAFAAGSVEKSAVYYRKALNRARLMDNDAAIGRNAYNLAACLVLLRRDHEARALLDEADAEFRRAGLSSPEIPMLRARLAYREGKTVEAMALVQAQLRASKSRDSNYIQYQILLADLLCAKADAVNAAIELDRVKEKDLAAESIMVQADAALARARIALLEKQPRAAGESLDKAAKLLQQAGQYVEMALALGEAGIAYEAAGDPNAAIDRDYRAARSLFLAGDLDRAEPLLASAVRLADQAGVAEMQSKLKQLAADIKAARAAKASNQ
jgi:tetratricopeptide (TPR) repeat protein